jgi:hypothetical protein
LVRPDKTKHGALIVLALFLAVGPLQGRSKTDVLHMKNGDKITCEIKNLERGRLTIKIDYMTGTHMVDWNEIERIESSQQFQVLWSDGEVSSGVLNQDMPEQESRTGKDARRLTVEASSQVIEERHPDEVVLVEQLGRNFWEQLDVKLDLGLSFLKDNDQRNTTVHAKVERLSRKRWVQADFNSFLSRSDAQDSTRHVGNLSYLHFFSEAWFAGGVVNLLRSDQQQLDLRTTASGLGGRLLVKRPDALIAAMGGMVLNRERFVTEESATNNWEAVAGARLNWYKFDSTDIQAQFLIYPGISDGGRYRFSFDTSAYLDLWGDLYVRFSLFDNFDSRPPTKAPPNDFGGSTTVGWSF